MSSSSFLKGQTLVEDILEEMEKCSTVGLCKVVFRSTQASGEAEKSAIMPAKIVVADQNLGDEEFSIISVWEALPSDLDKNKEPSNNGLDVYGLYQSIFMEGKDWKQFDNEIAELDLTRTIRDNHYLALKISESEIYPFVSVDFTNVVTLYYDGSINLSTEQ